ncbi:MAG TPA: rhodanese-like domain-containing protein [Sandaracinaceae bacterium LLY-WYZ-13_1]|nr:rhodanese-like domain-containing protein [Sandaracinaceae bacterium LLY-WYZ-13_1]
MTTLCRVAPYVSFLLASACSHAAVPEAHEASDAVERVSGRRARALVDRGAVLVDVRSRLEYLVRHVDGARNIPVAELPRRADELGDPETPIVVYCLSGHRSAEAARILEDAGFERVYDAGSIFAYGGGRHVRPPPDRPTRWGVTD